MWDFVLISGCICRILACCFAICEYKSGGDFFANDFFIRGSLLLFSGLVGIICKSISKSRANKIDNPESDLKQSEREVTKEDSDQLKVIKAVNRYTWIVILILGCVLGFLGAFLFEFRIKKQLGYRMYELGAKFFYPGLIGVILSNSLGGKKDRSKSKFIWDFMIISGCILCLITLIRGNTNVFELESKILINRYGYRFKWDCYMYYIGLLLVSFGLIGFTFNNRSKSAAKKNGSENHDGMQPVGENTKENSDQLEAVPVQKPITYKNNFSSDGMRSGISPEPPETKKIQNDPSLRPEKNQQMQDRKTEGIKVCKYCGHQYEPGETFCPDCGAVETEIKM